MLESPDHEPVATQVPEGAGEVPGPGEGLGGEGEGAAVEGGRVTEGRGTPVAVWPEMEISEHALKCS